MLCLTNIDVPRHCVAGTPHDFEVQLPLCYKAARYAASIGHAHVVEEGKGRKRGEKKTKGMAQSELNSRSFFFYWSHAEKQKLMHIFDSVDAAIGMRSCPDSSSSSSSSSSSIIGGRRGRRRSMLSRVDIHVTRPMCPDCISFFRTAARHEGTTLHVVDPDRRWEFVGGDQDSSGGGGGGDGCIVGGGDGGGSSSGCSNGESDKGRGAPGLEAKHTLDEDTPTQHIRS